MAPLDHYRSSPLPGGCFSTTTRANVNYLSLRGRQAWPRLLACFVAEDCANQIYWWDTYKSQVRKHQLNRHKDFKFLSPNFAEWLAGWGPRQRTVLNDY